MTWEAFATHMKDSYGSTELGFTRFMCLRLMTQGTNESVNAYYSRFRHTLGRQKKRMKHVDDNHIYYYMFIAGLEKETNAEVLRLPNHFVSKKWSSTRFWNLQSVLNKLGKHNRTLGRTLLTTVAPRKRRIKIPAKTQQDQS